MKSKIIAEGVKVNIKEDGQDNIVKINIIRNEKGNLELDGIGSVTYAMYDQELCLHKYQEG